MPEPPPADKPESVSETVDRLKKEHSTEHPSGCSYWVFKRTEPSGI